MDAIEIMDRMIFEEVPADDGLTQHLKRCSSCSKTYTDVLKAREMMNLLRRSEPAPSNPGELTANIMTSLQKGPEKTFVIPLHLMRMLAAASVVLFLLFGFEQYGFVKKISALEKQCAGIKSDARYSDLLQEASTLNISEAGISFSELERLLSTEKGGNRLSVFFIKKRLDQKNTK
jgi:predicted anti-sigma-YlaC factor YlaD